VFSFPSLLVYFVIIDKSNIAMWSILSGFLGIGIGLLCLWLILLILMQRPSANAGLGASLGGGVAESAFGGEASKVLTRWTVYGIVVFFLGTFGLSLGHISHKNRGSLNGGLRPIPVIEKGALVREEPPESPPQS
jgi:preprotein translocase subunit SecG